MARFPPFVAERTEAPSGGGGAESQPEVELSCYYASADKQLVSFYVADLGDGAGDRFAGLAEPMRQMPDDSDPASREYDDAIEEENAVVLVDVNYIGDISTNGTQYWGGAFGVVRNGSSICSVPLMGMSVHGSSGAQLAAAGGGVLKLLRYACGEETAG